MNFLRLNAAPGSRRPLVLALALPGLLLLTPLAQAHPGHSWADADARHLLTSPDHLTMIAGFGVLLLLAGWRIQRRLPSRIARVLGAGALAASALLWSLGS